MLGMNGLTAIIGLLFRHSTTQFNMHTLQIVSQVTAIAILQADQTV